MIGMEVRQNDRIQHPDPQTSQAGIDERRIWANVDQHRMTGCGRKDETVPLPDIARHEGARPAIETTAP